MLTLTNITKTFNAGTVNEKTALDNLSLHLDAGEFATIVGSNGAGKSTMFGAIAGNFYVDQGTIELDGEDITGLSITQRARKGISFAFQQPVRFKGVTVKDLICLASGQDLSTADACQYLSEVEVGGPSGS